MTSTRCRSPRQGDSRGWAYDLQTEEWVHAVNSGTFRCGRCPGCLQRKRQIWYGRLLGYWKLGLSERCWFLTLTWPEDRAADLAVDDVQRYIKRLRKSGSRFKYVFIWERTKRGWLHVHGLLFEDKGSAPLRSRFLDSTWPHFTYRRLAGTSQGVQTKVFAYVVKYLFKDQTGSEALPRILASQNLGGLTWRLRSNSASPGNKRFLSRREKEVHDASAKRRP